MTLFLSAMFDWFEVAHLFFVLRFLLVVTDVDEMIAALYSIFDCD